MDRKGTQKTGKALRQGRKADSLSDPLKELGGYQQAQHLGDLAQHNEDTLRQEAWIRQQKAAKLGVKPEDLDESAELANTAGLVGFSGSARDEEVIKRIEWDDSKLRDDILGKCGLVVSMASIGKPGRRQWIDLEGGEWVSAIMTEKKLRANYYTSSRNLVTNGPKALQVILARLPPWVGTTVAPILLSDPKSLKDRLVRLCEEFSERYNVDVVGAVVHRESDFDMHVHLVFSQTRESVIEKKQGTRRMRVEIKKVRDTIRADLRSQGKPTTNKAVATVFKELKQTGALALRLDSVNTTESVRYERVRRPNENVRRSTLGHAFLCKMQTWRAAEIADKEAVAAFRDKTQDHPRFDRSFQARFAGAETRGDVLEDLWWNLWLSGCWEKLCLDGLSREISTKSAERGRQAAKNYLNFGSTVPTLTERLSVEKRKLEEQVSKQSEQIEELKTELETTRETSRTDKADPKILAQATSRVEELERERDSLADQISEILKLAPGESLVAATTRVANQAAEARAALLAVTEREKDSARLKSTLNELDQTISSLKNEIAPLRELKEAVIRFLPATMKKSIKLDDNLIEMLKKIGRLVGEQVQLKREKPQEQNPGNLG